MRQSKFEAYKNIIQFHGLINGGRRIVDQMMQLDWYDFRHSTNFAQILEGEDFYSGLAQPDQAAVMHYQPVYTAAIRRPLRHLVEQFPIVHTPSSCFLDLGCGRGKALHVAGTLLPHATLLGIDLSPVLLGDARRNLGIPEGPEDENTDVSSASIGGREVKARLICCNVNDVDYGALLEPYDTIIVFNKNSFDRETTENTAEQIRKISARKKLFYIYSNPVFEDLFSDDLCVYQMLGWHKNWNTKIYQIF
jgi:SAM-dependent methyltransferase